MPLVSVIIPAYNRRDVIGRAIQSVLNQSLQDFEIIIIDDNSLDDTENFINGLSDSRIKYFKHTKNLGPAAARNTGLKIAKGEFFAFLDSDDEWMPNKLESQVAVFKNVNPNLGLVYVKSVIYKKGKLLPHLPYNWLPRNEGFIYDDLLRLNFIDTPATMIKREVIDSIGMFDENLKCLEDYDLFLRISQKFEIAFVNEPLLITHYSANGVNEQNLKNHADTLCKITVKNFGDYLKREKILSNRFLIIGDLYYQANDFRNSIKYFRRSLGLNRSNFKTKILFFTIKLLNYKPSRLYFLIRSILIKFNLVLTRKSGLY